MNMGTNLTSHQIKFGKVLIRNGVVKAVNHQQPVVLDLIPSYHLWVSRDIVTHNAI